MVTGEKEEERLLVGETAELVGQEPVRAEMAET